MAEILRTRTIYKGFADLIEADIRLDDGSETKREIEKHRPAVGFLPYDPERRVVLLAQLFRPPVLYEHQGQQLIEASAGLIDEGETGEEAARREAMEELGVRLTDLEPVGRFWSTPGTSTERLELFLARYGQADRLGPGGGAKGEHEGIKVLEPGLAEVWAQIEAGEVCDLKTLALVQALKLRRPKLFEVE